VGNRADSRRREAVDERSVEEVEDRHGAPFGARNPGTPRHRRTPKRRNWITDAAVDGGEILTERRGAVLRVTFNRPDVMNALTLAMYEQLRALCAEAAGDTSLRAVVFAGAGERAFVAGTDIAEFRAFNGGDDGLRYEEQMEDVLSTVEALPMPTVAALRGACTGGGLALASACDLRIGTPDVRIGYPMARTLGNCLSAANLARIVALVGEAATKEMLYTARLLDAQRSYALGFLCEIVAVEGFAARIDALAETIAGNAPLTIRATKETLRRMRDHGPYVDDSDLLFACYESSDFREGTSAFLEKRSARWSGT
jgi:enoyl-CoA hydratase/carnithine racemase